MVRAGVEFVYITVLPVEYVRNSAAELIIIPPAAFVTNLNHVSVSS